MNSRLEVFSQLLGALADHLAEPLPWLSSQNGLADLHSALNAAMSVLPEDGQSAAHRLLTQHPNSEERASAYRKISRSVTWYQSLAQGERMLGPTGERLRAWYAQSGLEVGAEELPDHVSVELTFLAYLCSLQSQAETPSQAGKVAAARRTFLREEVQPWLNDLGRDLAASGDPFFAPLGMVMRTVLRSLSAARKNRTGGIPAQIPALSRMEDCVLCGFCVQVCSQRALIIREDAQFTQLTLKTKHCTACGLCLKPCPVQTLKLTPAAENMAASLVLKSAPRAHCPRCGTPTVSQPELAWVQQHLHGLTSPKVQERAALCSTCKTRD